MERKKQSFRRNGDRFVIVILNEDIEKNATSGDMTQFLKCKLIKKTSNKMHNLNKNKLRMHFVK